MKKIFLTLLLAIAGMSWITAEEPVATIAENGIQFETVQLENGKAKVAVECLVHSKRAKGISLQLEVFYDNTRLYFRNRPYKQGEAIAFNVNLKNVHAWTPEYPNLYRAEFSLWLEEKEIGHRTVFFPVRTHHNLKAIRLRIDERDGVGGERTTESIGLFFRRDVAYDNTFVDSFLIDDFGHIHVLLSLNDSD